MKQSIVSPSGMPTANLAINKSRIKIYNATGSMPTYYLQKGQEFQIEIFNPTSDTILAKIHLNGTAITQGGLVVRPGERVFLDRYIDIAKKFLFDTYSVNNTAEVKKAIEDNGDFKVQFYRESKPNYFNQYGSTGTITISDYTVQPYYHNGFGTCNYYNHTVNSPLRGGSGIVNCSSNAGSSFTNTASGGITITSMGNLHDGSATLDWMSNEQSPNQARPIKRLFTKSAKSIETGRVEMGSESSQKLQTVNKTFDTWAFHTVEYKMLPLSQKVTSSEDLNVKRYCSNCGAKHKANYKFCPTCGSKA